MDGQKKRKSTKKDKDGLKKQKKQTQYVCKYPKMLLGVLYKERENNKIVTLGPNEVSVSPQQREFVIAGVYFNQTSVTLAGDFAANHNYSGVSVIARCLQGGS